MPMTRALEAAILGFVALATAVWLDLMPAAALLEGARLLLIWACGSTLLVALAGAWVALRRGRAGQRRPV